MDIKSDSKLLNDSIMLFYYRPRDKESREGKTVYYFPLFATRQFLLVFPGDRLRDRFTGI